MYRAATVSVVVADDSNLNQIEVNRKATMYQVADNNVWNSVVRVAPADSETQFTFPSLSVPYFFCLLSDYPIRVRLNGPSATQFTLVSSSTAATNVGAPVPDQCCMLLTGKITSIYLQPISGATTTANVKLILTGDPTNAYV